MIFYFLKFRIGLIPFDVLPNDADKAASNLMVDMWANFATYGKPIPTPDEMLEGGKKKLESLVCLIHYKREFQRKYSSKKLGGDDKILYILCI